VSGKLKFNVGELMINEHDTCISIDIRFPVTINKEEVCQKLRNAAGKYKLNYEEFDFLAPSYVPLESELVKNC